MEKGLFDMQGCDRVGPKITICIPHWQVKTLATICLRSIKKHSHKYDLEVIVVDNGSQDDSLRYLRQLNWIRLIERPEEDHTNWPLNVFTAWDLGLQQATGEYFVTMHTDVFVQDDNWLDPFLARMASSPNVAGTGAWKLVLENRFYALQKHVVGLAWNSWKRLLGIKKKLHWRAGHYPRDYCAMYRRESLLQHNLTFRPIHGQGGGYSIAKQIWNHGLETRMIALKEINRLIVHVAHGTAAVAAEKPLNHKQAQSKVERRVARLFQAAWIQSLRDDNSLDEGHCNDDAEIQARKAGKAA